LKRIAISQSNYIPWKGYFDLINMVDEFVIYDDAQYTSRDWRNRNKIKTPNGSKWLTIPVNIKGNYHKKINEIKINDKDWAINHWKQLKHNYSKARYFKKYEAIFEDLYLNCDEKYLSKINYKFISAINNILGIKTKLRFSNEFQLINGQTDRLLSICKQINAKTYFTGPTARAYFDENLAKKNDIKVIWINYNGYKKYEQLHPPFDHKVTILDLIFNADPIKFMKSFK